MWFDVCSILSLKKSIKVGFAGIGASFLTFALLGCQKQVSDATSIAACFDLRFEVSGFREFLWRRSCRLRGSAVQLRHHVRLERFRLGFRSHQLDRSGAAE